jgi:signal transduction histidine kinase
VRIPIRIRLTAVYCSAFLVVIAILAVGTYASVRAAVHTIVDHELNSRLDGVDDHLTRHVQRLGWPELSKSLALHPAFHPGLLRIADAGGAVLFEGTSIRGSSGGRNGGTPAFETISHGDQRLRVLGVRRTIQGQTYDLTLGTDLLIPGAILDRLWLVMLLSIPAVLLAASWAGYWISGRALEPVSAIIAAARSIDSTKLNERIAVPNTGDEIQQLAATTNGMLDRIEDGVRHIRQFTADASHELRTPVAIIRAAAEVTLLNRSANERTYRDALQRILHESEQSSKLLEDLLSLARADSGAERLEHEAVDLRTSVTAACARIMPLARTRGLAVKIPPHQSALWVDANEGQLRRLWLILLDNGLKNTPAGGSIQVATGTTQDGRPFCEVIDTGVGIPSEHLSRIFQRFYRVDKARVRSERGAGLGLAIAFEIATLHDAVIDVQSEPDRGASFRVTFPRRHAVVMAHVS